MNSILQKETAVNPRLGALLSRACKFGTRMELLGIKRTQLPPFFVSHMTLGLCYKQMAPPQFKEYWLKRCRIISLAGVPTCLAIAQDIYHWPDLKELTNFGGLNSYSRLYLDYGHVFGWLFIVILIA